MKYSATFELKIWKLRDVRGRFEVVYRFIYTNKGSVGRFIAVLNSVALMCKCLYDANLKLMFLILFSTRLAY